MPFDEALERFVQTDPEEVSDANERIKREVEACPPSATVGHLTG
jgi:hypothetical protein